MHSEKDKIWAITLSLSPCISYQRTTSDIVRTLCSLKALQNRILRTTPSSAQTLDSVLRDQSWQVWKTILDANLQTQLNCEEGKCSHLLHYHSSPSVVSFDP